MRAELDRLGISTVSASQGEQAHEVDLVLMEPKQLGQDVAELRRGFEETHPGVPVVVMGDAGLESAISAMRAGAADYVEPSTTALELASITRRLDLRARDRQQPFRFDSRLGSRLGLGRQ